MPMKHIITPRFGIVTEHGEGPLWDPVGQQLYWVDLLQGLFFTADLVTGAVGSRSVGQPLGVLAPRESGGLVMALRDGFALFSETTSELTWLYDRAAAHADPHHPPMRFNEGAVDPLGRFLAGTMTFDGGQNVGQLYVLHPDHRVTELTHSLHIPNGMNWSLDGNTFFLTDTGQHVIYAYDYDLITGAIANRREFIRFRDDEFPDGMTVDSEGGFWVAMWSGGCIRRFDAAGQPQETIPLPVTHPTSCCFGGNAMTDLFITTSRLVLTDAEQRAQPLAGQLLHLPTNMTGQVQRRYAG